MSEFKPFISSDQNIAEFSLKAVILGALFGVLFGASTVYLALRAGLTVSASIPISVLSIAILKKLGKSTILENNIVQTIGSAGEAVAAGVVFTVPALLFLSGGDQYFKYFQITSLALVGALLGVLFMIPLRRLLIVKEHGVLPYPEGMACAEVLIAGEKGGKLASLVFSGMWTATAYKLLMSVFGLWKDILAYTIPKSSAYPNATIMSEITPEYMGVGYIIGASSAGRIVAGSIISWLFLIPLISIFGDKLSEVLLPGWKGILIANMSPMEIYRGYVRYIGAGAIATSGILTVARGFPTLIRVFRDSIRKLGSAGLGGGARTDRDIPLHYVLIGAMILALVISVLPQFPGKFPSTLLMSLLIIVFGFIFVTVSSRMCGIVGSSANPVSGDTISTLMFTCIIFVAIGWVGESYQAVALIVGAVVCLAAANGGNTSQDLKTGFIVGATPYKQQVGFMIGILASASVVALTLHLLHTSPYGPIGSEKLAAPQATLMAAIIKGVLARELPWGLMIAGAVIIATVELMGVRSLPVALGIYLPMATTFPIFIGGLLKGIVSKVSKTSDDGDTSPGMLYSAGLVAGGSLAGIAIAVLAGVKDGSYMQVLNFGAKYNLIEGLGSYASLVSIAAFAFLGIMLIKTAIKKTSV